ncbi:substrate-binding domain-containing protein [Noviherbaspirillum sp. CPCC 100848]|uniref:Substrate-binding domain-containing protein n=1 Tax=Noviherbaspirillum album TaxID=3080276 RepID=A0ABU6J801_9BURK|nr:substrate-binding domain-containing protein [Noviherbaspirillum sp. CPCC 100848]MEC4719780.1 substrate-binding domain-containing protein [Noviherbaspirillum sp. CPCC 100848]
MLKITLSPCWHAGKSQPGTPAQVIDTSLLIRLLTHIDSLGSIASAGRAMQLSYRHVWGLLREAEEVFGATLIVKRPGHGTRLSDLASALLQADRRIHARLAPTLESLASEIETEIRKALPAPPAALRLFASHGFAVESLLALMRSRELPVEVRYRNSTEALAALANDECELAGFHVPVGEFEREALGQYMAWLSPEHMLIELATRRQGLFVAQGNPKGIAGLPDLVRSDVRFVNRQAGSGTRMLLELMLKKQGLSAQGINGFETAEFTHAAVAAYIAGGMADVGFGVETAAARFGLRFIALAEERYFFAVKKKALDLPTVTTAIGLLRSEAFLAAVSELKGYDASATGRVIGVEEAFSAGRGKPE